jgi:AraC-like DNA-binding protein
MTDWKTTAILLASGQGILLSLALLSPFRKQDKSNFFLGLILWVVSLELLSAWAMRAHYFNAPGAFHFYVLGSYLLWPPSVWLFAQLNTHPAFKLRKKHLLLFVPALVEIVVELAEKGRYHLTGHDVNMLEIKPWYVFTEIMPIPWLGVSLAFYGWRLVIFSRQLKNLSPPPSPVYRLKLYGLFTFLLLTSLLWVAELGFELPTFRAIELILTVFLFALGYVGYFNPAFFDVPRLLLVQPTPAISGTAPFPHHDDQQELRRLREGFEIRSLHVRTKLSLEELAGELNLPVRYVSYLINTYHDTNFHHFVNTYRVREVMRKMEDPAEAHKTLLALALEAGFNSKSTFNQVFKSQTGQSPSEYLRKVQTTGPKTRLRTSEKQFLSD